jgi:predicted acetyltransferase
MAYMASFVDALREGYSRDTLRPETPESIAQVADDPAHYLDRVLDPPTTVVLPDGTLGERVPETMLWYVDGERFIGSVGIRHRLNETLAIVGGHVGYAVRPAEQGKGHANAMLGLGIGHIRENLPLERVLLTVNSQNPASIRVIEKNGGVLKKSVPHLWREGETALHYWIEI